MEYTEEQEKKIGQKMAVPVYIGALIGVMGTLAYLGVFKQKGAAGKIAIGTGITMLGIVAGSAVGSVMVDNYKEELEDEDND